MFKLSPLILLNALFVSSAETSVQPEKCFAALDVVQVQDMTSSFDPLWMNMANQVESVMSLVRDSDENSFFGFSTFGDKPLTGKSNSTGEEISLGYETDYCFRVDVTLDKPDGPAMKELFSTYYQNAYGGGGDWSEDSFGAIYRALISQTIGWRGTNINGNPSARLLVLVTDAVGHLAGEVEAQTSVNLRPFDLNVEGIKSHSMDDNYDCDRVEYPTAKDVASLLQKTNTTLMVLAAPGGEISDDGTFIPYRSLAMKGKKYRTVDGLRLWYQDVLEAEGSGAVMTAQLDKEMLTYSEAFKIALKQYNEVRCAPLELTTELPTTTTTSSETVTIKTSVPTPTPIIPTLPSTTSAVTKTPVPTPTPIIPTLPSTTSAVTKTPVPTPTPIIPTLPTTTSAVTKTPTQAPTTIIPTLPSSTFLSSKTSPTTKSSSINSSSTETQNAQTTEECCDHNGCGNVRVEVEVNIDSGCTSC